MTSRTKRWWQLSGNEVAFAGDQIQGAVLWGPVMGTCDGDLGFDHEWWIEPLKNDDFMGPGKWEEVKKCHQKPNRDEQGGESLKASIPFPFSRLALGATFESMFPGIKSWKLRVG